MGLLSEKALRFHRSRYMSRSDRHYSTYLNRVHNSLLRKVLKGEKYLKLYSYHYLINGFAVLVTPLQVCHSLKFCRLFTFIPFHHLSKWFFPNSVGLLDDIWYVPILKSGASFVGMRKAKSIAYFDTWFLFISSELELWITTDLKCNLQLSA